VRPSELESLITEAPSGSERAPGLLPLAHVSSVGGFDSILASGKLVPRHCDLLQRSCVFLSYGAVHFRPASRQVIAQRPPPPELPIVFLFQPSLLSSVDRCYPFDTGALLSGRFGHDETGKEWRATFTPIDERCAVLVKDGHGPWSLVQRLYESNERYLDGNAVPRGSETGVLGELLRLLRADLRVAGIDQRQQTIECIASSELLLDAKLCWVGLPEGDLEADCYELLDRIDSSTRSAEVYAYPLRPRNLDPKALTALVAEHASAAIERLFRDRVKAWER